MERLERIGIIESSRVEPPRTHRNPSRSPRVGLNGRWLDRAVLDALGVAEDVWAALREAHWVQSCTR
jgi:hypothetical protein